jgi:hypothetical protein
VKKLDPRAVPGIIVGYRPSTKQYRVMALHPDMKYKVYIARQVIVNASHFQECFSSTAVSQVLQAFASVHCMDVLDAVSVPVHATVTPDVTHEEVNIVHAMALSTLALSKGSDHADDEPTGEPPIVVDNDDEGEIVASDAPEQERKITDLTVREFEPNHDQLSLEECTAITMARSKWLKVCNDFKVSLYHGEIRVHTKSAETVSDSICCAEQDA